MNAKFSPGWYCWLLGCWLPFALAGCDAGKSNRSPSEGSTAILHDELIGSQLTILVMNDRELAAALNRWQMEWKTLSGGTYTVIEATGEFPLDWHRACDVVIYPADWLGDLVERRLIMPVRTGLLTNDNYGLNDLFPLVWEKETRWEGRPYALSLGAPVLGLGYRTDLFGEHRLTPATHWEQYQEQVEFFSDLENWGAAAPPEGIAWQATVEPLAPGWAARTFLARAAGYLRHRNQTSTFFNRETMEPLIASPPFERALTELVEASGPLSLLASPQGAFLALANGRCAMALSWPSAAMSGQADMVPEVATLKQESLTKNLQFEELPGAMASYNQGRFAWEERSGEYGSRVTFLGMAGMLGSVSSETRNAPSANRLLAWITSSGVSQRVSASSSATTLFRMSHVATPEPWLKAIVERQVARQYTRALESALSRTEYLVGMRLPGATRYMAALDEAVRGAAEGKLNPEDALKQTARAWDAITEELGREQQRIAYLHSLGESAEPQAAEPDMGPSQLEVR